MPVSDFLQIVLQVISEIPPDRESPRSIDDLEASVAASLKTAERTCRAFVACTVLFLDFFGILAWQDGRCRLRGQIPDYFRRSLAWYLANREPVLANWERADTAREITVTNLLESAPYSLRLMEERRLALRADSDSPAGYSRTQRS